MGGELVLAYEHGVHGVDVEQRQIQFGDMGEIAPGLSARHAGDNVNMDSEL